MLKHILDWRWAFGRYNQVTVVVISGIEVIADVVGTTLWKFFSWLGSLEPTHAVWDILA
jgi:hypothetical protein